MNCLSHEQLIELALERKVGSELEFEPGHVGICGSCAARLEELQEQLGRVETAMSWFDRDHPAARQRLLAAIAVDACRRFWGFLC